MHRFTYILLTATEDRNGKVREKIGLPDAYPITVQRQKIPTLRLQLDSMTKFQVIYNRVSGAVRGYLNRETTELHSIYPFAYIGTTDKPSDVTLGIPNNGEVLFFSLDCNTDECIDVFSKLSGDCDLRPFMGGFGNFFATWDPQLNEESKEISWSKKMQVIQASELHENFTMFYTPSGGHEHEMSQERALEILDLAQGEYARNFIQTPSRETVEFVLKLAKQE